MESSIDWRPASLGSPLLWFSRRST
jgi:hypothetical protein